MIYLKIVNKKIDKYMLDCKNNLPIFPNLLNRFVYILIHFFFQIDYLCPQSKKLDVDSQGKMLTVTCHYLIG